MGNSPTEWSKLSVDDRIRIIASVWKAGMSASDIAEAIARDFPQYPVSRNAVIGFYHRVAGRAKRSYEPDPLLPYHLLAPPRVVRGVRKSKVAVERLSRVRGAVARKPRPAPVAAPPAEPAELSDLEDLGTGISLEEMHDSKTCKWPTGQDERGRTLFCGRERELIRSKPTLEFHPSYCGEHHRRSVKAVP